MNDNITINATTISVDSMVRELKSTLITKLENGFRTNPAPLVRAQVEIPAPNQPDALKWLAAQKNKIKLYFSGRDQWDRETAGVGAADSIFIPGMSDGSAAGEAFEHMKGLLSPGYPQLKYYGGFSFSAGHVDADWENFGACHCVVPRFEMVVENRRTFLACNVKMENKEPVGFAQIKKELEELELPAAFQGTGEEAVDWPAVSKITGRIDRPPYERWVSTLTGLVEEIKKGLYKKTVAARKVDLTFPERLDAVALLAQLKKLPSRRYDFLFQLDGERAFLGSSPERLYKRKGREILSEAIAGTRVRGSKERDDSRLEKELLDSNKEQREHDFVIDTIAEELKPLCTSLDISGAKGVVKLKEGQHLISYVRGILKEHVTDEILVNTLHPTPAVAGCPLKDALKAIAKSEPFKRGWYAGVIGAVGYDEGDFAVGIRSGYTYKNRLSLYSGVGVVEGSNADDEWNELNCKISNFLDIVGD